MGSKKIVFHECSLIGEFIQVSSGKNANEAFRNAVNQAEYDHGHSGYTGTIAEKDDFVEILLPKKGKKDPEKRAVDYAMKLIDDCDARIDDKWGPAGCIKIKTGKYLFFGWARVETPKVRS